MYRNAAVDSEGDMAIPAQQSSIEVSTNILALVNDGVDMKNQLDVI
jgi:hypothetical protein